MTTTTETREVLDKVHAILEAEFGEHWYDGNTVSDVIVGIAEPGYGSDEDVLVLGDWNPKRFLRHDLIGPQIPLSDAENVGPRLAEALEEAGAQLAWLDEWTQCQECYRAIRTEADSYSWQMYGQYVEGWDGHFCADCIAKDAAGFVEAGGFVNNSDVCIRSSIAIDLTDLGFVQWEERNPHSYANGWYEGQNDRPDEILAEILRWDPDAEVVFKLDGVGQFDIHFSAWVKSDKPDDEEADDDD